MESLKEHIDRLVLEQTIKWVKFSLVLSVLFLLLDPWTIPHDLPIALLIRFSSMVVLWLALRRLTGHRSAIRQAETAALLLGLLLLSISVSYYVLIDDPYFDVYIQLLLIANGLLSLQASTVLAMSAADLIAWVAAHWFVSAPFQTEQLLMVVAAATIGYHAYLSRRKIVLDQWTLQEGELNLKSDLLVALKSAQDAKALLNAEEAQASSAVSQALEEIIVSRKQRSRLHRHLLHSNRLSSLGRLAAGLAHRLNNRLLVLLGTVDNLELDFSGEESREVLTEVRHAVERGAKLVEQLLPLTGHQLITPETVTTEELLRQFHSLLSRPRSPLKVKNLAPRASIKVDREAWFQILSNLVRNADEVNPKERPIHLVVEEEDSAVVFSVKDRGPGVPKEYRERIFEPFFTTKADRGGTGLGLSIVLGLVEQMGGHLTVSSRTHGGSVFSVAFDSSGHSLEAVPPQTAREATSRPLEGKRVLVVEDDPRVLRLLECQLQRMGISVKTASNGQEGLKCFQAEPVSLVITDVVMPVMDGPSLAKELWKCDPSLKVLFTSGYSDDRLKQAGLSGSAIQFLPKPYNRETLTQALQRALRFRSAEE